MSKEYIIVVEVDNKRALAAFQKGYDDIQLVLPQFMLVAQKKDDDIALKAKTNKERREADVRDYDARLKEYEDARKAYEDYLRLPWISRSSVPAPFVPPEVSLTSNPRLSSSFFSSTLELRRPYNVASVESFVAELKRNRDIASAASAPYKMVERDALAMVGWEDGSSLEYAKRLYLD